MIFGQSFTGGTCSCSSGLVWVVSTSGERVLLAAPSTSCAGFEDPAIDPDEYVEIGVFVSGRVGEVPVSIINGGYIGCVDESHWLI